MLNLLFRLVIADTPQAMQKLRLRLWLVYFHVFNFRAEQLKVAVLVGLINDG